VWGENSCCSSPCAARVCSNPSWPGLCIAKATGIGWTNRLFNASSNRKGAVFDSHVTVPPFFQKFGAVGEKSIDFGLCSYGWTRNVSVCFCEFGGFWD
jgi:hypothetical protein